APARRAGASRSWRLRATEEDAVSGDVVEEALSPMWVSDPGGGGLDDGTPAQKGLGGLGVATGLTQRLGEGDEERAFVLLERAELVAQRHRARGEAQRAVRVAGLLRSLRRVEVGQGTDAAEAAVAGLVGDAFRLPPRGLGVALVA